MIIYIVNEDKPFEQEYKRFKHKVEKEGVLRTFLDHRYFYKPSALRRRKKAEASRRD